MFVVVRMRRWHLLRLRPEMTGYHGNESRRLGMKNDVFVLAECQSGCSTVFRDFRGRSSWSWKWNPVGMGVETMFTYF